MTYTPLAVLPSSNTSLQLLKSAIVSFVKGFVKVEVYYSSNLSAYTTNNFYSFQSFTHHRRPSSGITDHADCVIDWEGAKMVDRETKMCARWIAEAI